MPYVYNIILCVGQGDAGVGLDSALEATVDAQEWRLEVERVLPSLKIHIRQDNRVSSPYRASCLGGWVYSRIQVSGITMACTCMLGLERPL